MAGFGGPAGHHGTAAPAGAERQARPAIRGRRGLQDLPDALLIDKIRDVTGLYLAPPEHAAVFTVDEKPQIQALQPTAGAAHAAGCARARSHDDIRHGTVDLLAALNIATGKVIG